MITTEDINGLELAVNDMIQRLDNMPENEAVEYATNVLIEAGVLNSDGSEKEQIVNGDFFGW